MAARDSIADQVLDSPESTVLDLLDRLLDKGVTANGDLTLGVAGVDLVYIRLSALLCAVDRVFPRSPAVRKQRRRASLLARKRRLKLRP